MEWALMPLRKYSTFTGRSQRKEYWLYILFVLVVVLVLTIIENMLGWVESESDTGALTTLFMFGILLPSIAVATRRLHDIGRSGWWQLVSLIPLIGPLVLLFWLVKDSDSGENTYGPNPKS